jgi:hypothetical protein
MRIVSQGHIQNFDDVEPGTCLAFEARTGKHFGLKATKRPPDAQPIPFLVTLSPGYEFPPGTPGLFDPSVLKTKAVYAYHDPALILPSRGIHWEVSGAKLVPGFLGDTGKGCFLIAKNNQDDCFVNMETGLIEERRVDEVVTWFSRWSIVLAGNIVFYEFSAP